MEIKNTVPEVTLKRIDRALAHYSRKLADAKRGKLDLIIQGDITAYLHHDVPDWSKAFGLGAEGADHEAQLAYVEQLFRGRKLTPAISVSDSVAPALLEIAFSRGWKVTDRSWMLIRPLSNIEPFADAKSEWVVSAVSEAELHLWSKTIAAGYTDDEAISEDDDLLHLGLARVEGTTCTLARTIRGEVAGAAMAALIPEESTVSLISASTLPAFRRRGLQQLFIRHRMQLGRDAGMEYAIVSCLPDSASGRNAIRAGFTVACERMLLKQQA